MHTVANKIENTFKQYYLKAKTITVMAFAAAAHTATLYDMVAYNTCRKEYNILYLLFHV